MIQRNITFNNHYNSDLIGVKPSSSAVSELIEVHASDPPQLSHQLLTVMKNPSADL
jgi:hypothetical protein